MKCSECTNSKTNRVFVVTAFNLLYLPVQYTCFDRNCWHLAVGVCFFHAAIRLTIARIKFKKKTYTIKSKTSLLYVCKKITFSRLLVLLCMNFIYVSRNRKTIRLLNIYHWGQIYIIACKNTLYIPGSVHCWVDMKNWR